jgi:hypothetical protein
LTFVLEHAPRHILMHVSIQCILSHPNDPTHQPLLLAPTIQQLETPLPFVIDILIIWQDKPPNLGSRYFLINAHSPTAFRLSHMALHHHSPPYALGQKSRVSRQGIILSRCQPPKLPAGTHRVEYQ